MISHHAVLLISPDFRTHALSDSRREEICGSIAQQDFYKVSTKGSIKIEDIEQVCSLSYYGPVVSSKRVILIERVDTLTQNAANKFLKTLEEPAAKIQFLLTSPSLHEVLPTIRSRCFIIKELSSVPEPLAILQEKDKIWLEDLFFQRDFNGVGEKKLISPKELHHFIIRAKEFSEFYDFNDLYDVFIRFLSLKTKKEKDVSPLVSEIFLLLKKWKKNREYNVSSDLWILKLFLLIA